MPTSDSLQEETIPTPETVKPKQLRRRVSFKLTEETIAALDEEFEMAELADRDALVERLLRECLHRREREAEYAK